MVVLFLSLLLLSFLLHLNALRNDCHKSIKSNDVLKTSYRRCSISSSAIYLKEDGGLDDNNSNDNNKQKRKIISKKIINPEDVDSFFGLVSNSDYVDDEVTDDDNNDIDNSMNDNDDNDVNDIEKNEKAAIQSSSSSSPISRYDASGRETDVSSSSMIELGSLERMIRTTASTSININDQKILSENDSMNKYKSDDDIDKEINSAYTELDSVLDKDKRRYVRDSMSMKDIRSSSSSLKSSLKSSKSITVSTLDSPRAVQYDPTEYFRGDPMKYGAYRRWKLAEQEIIEKKNSKGKKKQGKLKKNGKDENPFNPDNFYNALKKLGSGPSSKDTPTGLGVADAPKNKPPITPKKGLTKKNKKKIITPDDIDKLFETKSAIKGSNDNSKLNNYEEEEDDDDDEEEEEDEDEDELTDNVMKEENNELISNLPTLSTNPAVSFNEMVSKDEEIPKWLAEADKEAKKKRAMRGKKKKRLQDDWRFWLAIIASVGFVSAFWNIYQSTGGNFENGPASFGFGLPTIGGGGSGDELVL